MDLAQTLIRSVLRQFYEPRYVLVIDALIIHSALRDDDLAYLLGMNLKELHKLCGKLREDRWLAVQTRSEAKEGNTRPVNRTYYYIDYRATIDMVKYKVLVISKSVQGSTIPENERMEYICPRCKFEYTALDLAALTPTIDGMECGRCGDIVVENPNANVGGHIQSTAWTTQIKYIMDLLQKIDEVVIPPNSFELAYGAALPVARSETNPGTETAPVETTLNRPTAVKGLADTGPKTIAITVTATDGPSAADIAAEAAKKQALAAANAMPEHFKTSTVSGDAHILEKAEPTKAYVSTPPTESKPKINAGAADDDIADFFARLKAEQVNEDKKDAEDDQESDDEDEFEDVVPVAGNSAVGTPASLQGIDSPKLQGLPSVLTGVLKKPSHSQSNSGTSTGVTSPASGTPEGERAAKRVRIEEPVKVKEDVESDEEELEFEDV